MKRSSTVSAKTAAPVPTFTEEDIRSYAEHLYEQSGRIPGRDLDNWLEAKACLEACVPREQSHRRLQEHLGAARSHAPAAPRARAREAAEAT
jgi:hypothetical protein